MVFFFKQKTAYEVRISDWSSDVCSSDLQHHVALAVVGAQFLDGPVSWRIVPGRSGGAVGEGDDDEVAGPVSFQHGLAAAMDDVAPAEGRQGGIDPLQVLDDGRSHPDTVQVGDGIGGHGGLLVVSVMRPARRLAQRSGALRPWRSEEHTSELQSLMRISYAVFCLKKKRQ